MTTRHPVITIDGPSGSGKSTLSRRLAAALCYTFLDTGAMYRAVGLQARRCSVDLDDEKAVARLLENLEIRLTPNGDTTRVYLHGEDVTEAIRTADMGLVASRVSALPAIRRKLTELQREMADHGPLVAEGRDMGTVVFPYADYKFYLDASPRERARRRTEQLRQMGQEAEYEEILQQIIKRDQNDSSRSIAPLMPAEDAETIDSSTLSIEDVLTHMLRKITSRES